MEKISNTPEGRLMVAIFGQSANFYPYIIVEERKVELMNGLKRSFENLPLSKGKNDSQKWARWQRILELHFGLKDGIVRSLSEVGKELGGITYQAVRQMENRALRKLQRSKYLRQFLIPSSEETDPKASPSKEMPVFIEFF